MDSEKSYQKLLAKIASNIKSFRERAKLTQEQMAEHGFNYRHYQRLESGKHSPSLYTLHRLSKMFKVDIDVFFS